MITTRSTYRSYETCDDNRECPLGADETLLTAVGDPGGEGFWLIIVKDDLVGMPKDEPVRRDA